MAFTQSLKLQAQHIIEFSEQLAGRAHTWNQEESAPSGGYRDRAGFIVFDDIELFADVYISQDKPKAKLRARLAWAPKDKDQELFTIITLDFESDVKKTNKLVSKSDSLTRQDIANLLNEDGTKPHLVHVSLGSGVGKDGKTSGKRYEYSSSDINNLTDDDKSEFIDTLTEAYGLIEAKVQGHKLRGHRRASEDLRSK